MSIKLSLKTISLYIIFLVCYRYIQQQQKKKKHPLASPLNYA